jgi:hypothetical protein
MLASEELTVIPRMNRSQPASLGCSLSSVPSLSQRASAFANQSNRVQVAAELFKFFHLGLRSEQSRISFRQGTENEIRRHLEERQNKLSLMPAERQNECEGASAGVSVSLALDEV